MQRCSILARAKLNLYLHVTGRQDDGYHDLETLIAFADWGDVIQWSDDSVLDVMIDGPFAGTLSETDNAVGPHSSNLMIRAIHAYAAATHVVPRGHWHLSKQIPPGGGLGGGSADAAAALRMMEMIHGVTLNAAQAHALCQALGADVWMCYRGKAGFYAGRGDVLRNDVAIPAQPVLIVYPGVASSTPRVYEEYRLHAPNHGFHVPNIHFPRRFNSAGRLRAFIAARGNDLAAPAMRINPEMAAMQLYVETVLRPVDDPGLVRVTGSGSCLFVLGEAATLNTVNNLIAKENPAWSRWLGRIG